MDKHNIIRSENENEDLLKWYLVMPGSKTTHQVIDTTQNVWQKAA